MSATLTERVADYLRARPGVWVDGRDLEPIGGRYAWRSRISDCRTRHGMTIQNRQRKLHAANGARYTVSEYRYLPPAPQAQAALPWEMGA